jgi:hypothetical protein
MEDCSEVLMCLDEYPIAWPPCLLFTQDLHPRQPVRHHLHVLLPDTRPIHRASASHPAAAPHELEHGVKESVVALLSECGLPIPAIAVKLS